MDPETLQDLCGRILAWTMVAMVPIGPGGLPPKQEDEDDNVAQRVAIRGVGPGVPEVQQEAVEGAEEVVPEVQQPEVEEAEEVEPEVQKPAAEGAEEVVPIVQQLAVEGAEEVVPEVQQPAVESAEDVKTKVQQPVVEGAEEVVAEVQQPEVEGAEELVPEPSSKRRKLTEPCTSAKGEEEVSKVIPRLSGQQITIAGTFQPQESPDAPSSDDHGVQRVEEEDKEEDRGGEDVTCPLSKVDLHHCYWRGPLRTLKNHVAGSHMDVINREKSFPSKNLLNTVSLLFYHGDIFLCYKMSSYNGTMFTFVQQVGLTHGRFTCRVQIASQDESTEDIDTRFRINSITETFEASADSGRCFAIRTREMEHFITNDEFDMVMTIEEFHEHKQTEHDETTEVASKVIPSPSGQEITTAGTLQRQQSQDVPSSDDQGEERVEEQREKKEEKGGESVTCPLSKIYFKHCDWRGPLRTLKDHVFERHSDVLRRFNFLECRGVENRVLLIFYQEDIFLYFKRITYTGHMYIFVQQVGLTETRFTCKVQIGSQDETREHIDTRFPINSITETLELSAETGKCLAIDEREIEYFIRNDEFDMVMIIEKLHEHKQTEHDEPTEEASKVIPRLSGQEITIAGTFQQQRRDAPSSDDHGVEKVEEEQEKKEERGGESVTCPLSKIDFYLCDWRGPLRTLKNHVAECHTDIFTIDNFFECRCVANRVLLIFYQTDVFLYFKKIAETGHMYIFVQQVGLTDRRYTYTVQIGSQDESTEDIETRFPINSNTETFKESAETGKCLAIHATEIKRFIRNDKIDMVVIIEEFHEHKQTEHDEPTEEASKVIPRLSGQEITIAGTSQRQESQDAPSADDHGVERVEQQEKKEERGGEGVTCPLSKVEFYPCDWRGLPRTLNNHVAECHTDILTTDNFFECRCVANRVLLLLYQTDMFLYFKHIEDTGHMYIFVQQVGLTDRRYTYTVQIGSQDESTEDIETRFPINSITETFKESAETGTCLAIDATEIKLFIRNDEIDMVVIIEELHEHKQTEHDEPTEEAIKVIPRLSGQEITIAGTSQRQDSQDALSSEDQGEQRVEEEREKKEERGGEDVTCPLSKIDFKHCDWRGPLRTLKDHVSERHTDVFKIDNFFDCKAIENRVLLLFYEGDMFLYFKRIVYTGHMYIFVQQVGFTDRRHTCRVQIASYDDSREDIDTRFPINSITETFKESAESGNCVAIDVHEIEHFIRNNKIDMVVIIE